MVNVIPFKVEGWHAPADRRTCDPRPLVQEGQIRTAAPVDAGISLGPGRQIDSQDNQPDVSRFASQTGTQDSRPYAPNPPRPGMQARSTTSSSLPNPGASQPTGDCCSA